MLKTYIEIDTERPSPTVKLKDLADGPGAAQAIDHAPTHFGGLHVNPTKNKKGKANVENMVTLDWESDCVAPKAEAFSLDSMAANIRAHCSDDIWN